MGSRIRVRDIRDGYVMVGLWILSISCTSTKSTDSTKEDRKSSKSRGNSLSGIKKPIDKSHQLVMARLITIHVIVRRQKV